jgi:hypothetical protein
MNTTVYFCDTCSFYSNRKQNIERHLKTNKHKILTYTSNYYTTNNYNCCCGSKNVKRLKPHILTVKHINYMSKNKEKILKTTI